MKTHSGRSASLARHSMHLRMHWQSLRSMQGNFEKPDEEELAQTAKDTAAALNLVVTGKLQAAQPKTLPKQPGAATYIKYTPQQQGPQYASGARERTIKMQDMPVDPMEPPKFRHKKVHASAGFALAQSFLLAHPVYYVACACACSV